MAKVLCIETSSENCSVSLFEDEQLLAFKESSESFTHSEHLHPFIHEMMKGVKVDLNDLNAIAVSEGPGSFTGLRIGVAAAKGMCFALDLPLISVSTMRCLLNTALSMTKSKGTQHYVPLIDARRMEVYTCTFDHGLNMSNEVHDEIINEDSFGWELSKGPTLFFGSGMPKVKQLFEQNQNANFLEDVRPSSQFMIEEALQKYKQSEFEDVAYFEPFYLKPFMATTPKKLI